MTQEAQRRVNELRQQIDRWNYEYYILDAPSATDAEWDAAMNELLPMVAEGALSKSQGQQVLTKMVETGRSPREIAEESGIKQVSDEGALEAAIDAVLAANPDVAETDIRRRVADKEIIIGFG